MKLLLIILLTSAFTLNAQTILLLNEGTNTNIRGLSVVTNDVLWVSGNKGMVGLSLNGGALVQWQKIPGYENTDFRDIEAFSSTEAIIMGIDKPAYILKTNDAGRNWKRVYYNNNPGIFLDAMHFWNQQSGIVIGDPIDSTFFVIRTFDEGNTWQTVPQKHLPKATKGEACFASSGSNITAMGNNKAVFISGGLQSNFYNKNDRVNLPLLQGKESTGANSVAVSSKQKNVIIVGGDFTQKNDTTGNCAISNNAGKTFTRSVIPPNGYRSCVAFYTKTKAITCGLNGVDVTNNAGYTWKNISNTSYNVCAKAKTGNAVYVAGSNGKIGKLITNEK